MATFIGTSANDTLTGTASADTFDLLQGGEDTASGLDGDDIFILGGTLDTGDRLDGGAGFDQIWLRGDYSTRLKLEAPTIASIERIALGAGFDYSLLVDSALVAPGASLTVDASKLGAANTLNFTEFDPNASRFSVTGGAGDDVLNCGNGNDHIDLSRGGNDTAAGGGGNDTFLVGDAFTPGDHIDGGLGNDVVKFAGNYSGVTLSGDNFMNVEIMQFETGYDYSFVAASNLDGDHGRLKVDASPMTGGSFAFDGSAEPIVIFHFLDGGGSNTIIGGARSDTFDLERGTADIVQGGGGDDVFYFADNFGPLDSVDGGAGTHNAVYLDGDYPALTITPAMLANVQSLTLGGGHDYDIAIGSIAVGGRGYMVIDGHALGAADHFTLDTSADTTAYFDVIDGAGVNDFTSGAALTAFDCYHGSQDDVHTGSGGSGVSFLGNFTRSDIIVGGAGYNSLQLLGSYGSHAAPFLLDNVTGFEALIVLDTGDNYLKSADSLVQPGATFVVNLSFTGDHTNSFDGSAETDGRFDFIDNGEPTLGHRSTIETGGAGNDMFENSAYDAPIENGEGGNDTMIAGNVGGNFTGGLGADNMTAGAGADTFVYNAVPESTGTTHDTIHDVNFTSDVLKVSAIGAVTGIDAAVTTGTLSTSSFDTRLAAAIGPGQLAAHHAVLFTANAGTLSGHTILVVDENGAAGYQSGGDLVIDVTGFAGTLTTGSFM